MSDEDALPPGGGGFALGAKDRLIRRRFAVDGRVRSGCLTCKARKKKCDGQISSAENRCRACVRLGLVCEQPALRRVTPRRRTTSTASAAASTASGPFTIDDNLKGPGIQPQTHPDGQPDLFHDESTHNNIPEDDDDDAEPIYQQEQQQQQGEATASAEAEASPPPTSSSLPSSSLILHHGDRSYVGPLLNSLDSIEPLLLKYFLSDVAPLCSILQQDGASFCSVLLPMAIVDSSLLHALFTYASVHFDANAPLSSSSSSATRSAITPRARLSFESNVARGISDAIARNSVTESTVACALVVSTAHVIGGDTSRWLLHLQGAGHLVNHLGPLRLLKMPDGVFLLRYFAYHDIMAALSTGRRPSIEGVYWVPDVDANVESADSFMGLAHHVFRHITNICEFVADTADLSSSSSSSSSAAAAAAAASSSPPDCDRLTNETLRAESIAQALSAQDLRLQLRSTSSHSEALVHHAEAFRFAALFHLYRHLLLISGGLSAMYERHMAECVQHIFHHVSLVPFNLYCEIGLLFPLFMAGVGGGNDASTVQYIQTRLDYIETWTKFKHVTRARELLQRLWEQQRTDWEVMLQELDWKISLA